MSYDNFPRRIGVGEFSTDDVAEIKKIELAGLKYFALDTGGVTLLGGQKFNEFQRVIDSDLSSYYELSYYPPKTKADGKYHKIQVKVKRPGIKIRFRQGYYDYTDEQKESLLFASASSNPSLFDDISFQARVVPFVQSKNESILWINLALPVKKLFLEDSDVDSKNLKISLWVEDLENEKAFSTKVNLPINLTPSFRRRLKAAKYFGFNMCSQELKLKKEDYRIIFALFDEKNSEMGTVVQEFKAHSLKETGKREIVNAVLGRLIKTEKREGRSFSISKRDGTLQLKEFKFYPMGINHFNQGESISLFLQVHSPLGKEGFKPEFILSQMEEERGKVPAEDIDESWNKKAKTMNYVFKLNFSEFPRGEYELSIKDVDSSGNLKTAKKYKIRII
jgi:hypothetical protein